MSAHRPIIGLLCRPSTKKMLLRQKVTYRPKLLYKACRKVKATVYFFVANDFNKEAKKIRGVYYNRKSKKWKRKYFPLPQIIYRLGGTYTPALYPDFHKALRSHNTLLLNLSTSLDKYEQYERLVKHPSTAQCLPKTHKVSLKRRWQLSLYLNYYKAVYIKATSSFQSKGVMRVQKKRPGSYQYAYYLNGTWKKGIVSFAKLMVLLRHFFYEKEIFIQEEIPLITTKHTTFDIRTELHRSTNNEIKVAGCIASEHLNGNFKSRISKCYNLRAYLKRTYNYTNNERKALIQKVKKLSIDTYKALETSYGPLGEIGIDLGIDKNGRLWIIEANLSSGKRSLYKVNGSAPLEKSYIEMFSYAIQIQRRKGVLK